MASWADEQTKGLPKCLNCGHPVSVKGDARHGGDDVPDHHFWTEDVACHPDDVKAWRGQSIKQGQHGFEKPRLRHGE